MGRVVRNLVRLPRRTLQGLRNWLDPVYGLQRRADREVPRWLTPPARARLAAIPGLSSDREGHLLAYLVGQSPPGGCVVEIGAFKGKSTAWLVEAAQRRSDRPPVISIDPHGWGTWEAFQETVARFQLCRRGLEVHRAASHDIGASWDRPISFLWVDGSHEYEDVVTDIEDFVPHVLPGGWIVFDDARGGKCPGVPRALAERMIGRRGYRHHGAIKRFELFQRRPGRSPLTA